MAGNPLYVRNLLFKCDISLVAQNMHISMVMTGYRYIFLIAFVLLIAAVSTHAEVTGTWEVYPSVGEVTDIAVHGDYVWCATWGGVVRWNRLDGTHRIYSDIPNYMYGMETAIAVDSRGRAWFGTLNSLVCIDGDEVSIFTKSEGYLVQQVFNIAVDQNDNIWIIPADQQNGALIMFDGSTFHSIDMPGDYLYYNLLHPDSSGRIWVNTVTSPAYFYNGSWTIFEGSDIDAIAENANGTLCFFMDCILYTFNDSTFVPVDNEYPSANHMAFDSVGNLWLASSRGLNRYDGSSITEYPQPDIYKTTPSAIAIDEDDNVWLGSYKYGCCGLIRFDGVEYTRFEPNSPASIYVDQSTLDTSGVLWCATWNGLCSFDGETWRWNHLQEYHPASAIVRGRNNDLWAGMDSGVYHYDGEQWREMPGPDAVGFSYFGRALAVDSDNAAWAFMGRTGLWRIDGSTCEHVLPTDSLFTAHMPAIAIDHDDVKWIGTDNGVYRYDGDTIKLFQPSEDEEGNRITSIAVDDENRIWCGGASVFIIEDGKIELRNPSRKRDDVHFCPGVVISIGPDGRIWAVMRGACAGGERITGGFAVYEGGEWSIVPVPEGIDPGNNIFAASDGTIWISNEPGVIHFTPDSGPLAVDRRPELESISLSNAPNPFNPATTITFTLPRSGRVSVRIYSITGQVVATLADEWRDTGIHTLTWDASGCAAGLYYCHVISGDCDGAVKMTLVK